MNLNQFHQKVNDFYRTAKRAKRTVAEFFLAHPEEVAFMTLDDVSRRTGVSPATITRTATEIGFRGYPGLQEEVRRSVRRSLAPTERLERAPVPEGSLGYPESLAIDQRNLQALPTMNDASTVEEAIALLSAAPHVYLFASRTSYSAISFLGFLLAQIRPGVRLLTEDEGRWVEQLLDLEGDDLLMTMALPRYARIVVRAMEQGRARGCRVISISDGPLSPLCRHSNLSLFVPYESYSFFNSTVPAMALVNALATGVNLRLGGRALRRLEEHDRMMDAQSLLLSPAAEEED